MTVELDVIREEPEVKDHVEFFSKPVLWTWLKKQVLDKEQRGQILARVFEIKLVMKDDKHRRDDLFLKRNEVAHGRSAPEITLAEYLDLDAFVAKSMLHIAAVCQKKQKLIV